MLQDPLVQVADAVARESKVLCLDEFFVNDVADAAILNRLFSRLWENGLVLVSTSNRQPDSLYEGGLQRNLFLPFIDKLKVGSAYSSNTAPYILVVLPRAPLVCISG